MSHAQGQLGRGDSRGQSGHTFAMPPQPRAEGPRQAVGGHDVSGAQPAAHQSCTGSGKPCEVVEQHCSARCCMRSARGALANSCAERACSHDTGCTAPAPRPVVRPRPKAGGHSAPSWVCLRHRGLTASQPAIVRQRGICRSQTPTTIALEGAFLSHVLGARRRRTGPSHRSQQTSHNSSADSSLPGPERWANLCTHRACACTSRAMWPTGASATRRKCGESGHELRGSDRTCGEPPALRGEPWASKPTKKVNSWPQGSHNGGLAGQGRGEANP